jgi:hypothetical protein
MRYFTLRMIKSRGMMQLTHSTHERNSKFIKDFCGKCEMGEGGLFCFKMHLREIYNENVYCLRIGLSYEIL